MEASVLISKSFWINWITVLSSSYRIVFEACINFSESHLLCQLESFSSNLSTFWRLHFPFSSESVVLWKRAMVSARLFIFYSWFRPFDSFILRIFDNKLMSFLSARLYFLGSDSRMRNLSHSNKSPSKLSDPRSVEMTSVFPLLSGQLSKSEQMSKISWNLLNFDFPFKCNLRILSNPYPLALFCLEVAIWTDIKLYKK